MPTPIFWQDIDGIVYSTFTELDFAMENTPSKCRISDKRCCDKTGASII
jgi:hypothetical protein